jgi:hypothetical protein
MPKNTALKIGRQSLGRRSQLTICELQTIGCGVVALPSLLVVQVQKRYSDLKHPMLQNLVVLLVLLSDWTVASPRSPAIRRVQVSGLQATIDRTRFLLDFATEYAPESKS